ncbi:NUDIX hydrolase [Streptomyces fenghuangensis]|uniref:NUDIX domain-containing protein n=1 Tax=Streptomyces chitinivorans TaxID=1257027 RepID=A0ABW7HPL4_9ACTN|nr:NUDIX domain-containing protein [Streptomyces chitinivorans]MDH2409143.1 NUDIX domain-containing protein [Streptomyces chitinivorans]
MTGAAGYIPGAPGPVRRLIDTVAWVHLRGGVILGARTRGKDLFYIPGGKRHPGESDEQTLLREVEEELTVAIVPGTIAHVGTYEAPVDAATPQVVVRMACYTGDYRGTLAAAGEIEEIRLLSYADRDLVPPVDQLVFDELYAAGRLS